MYKVCKICRKGFHTGVSTKTICDRAKCQERNTKKNPVNLYLGRDLAKFKTRIEAEENIVNSVAEARKRKMSYGVYTAYKERHWLH